MWSRASIESIEQLKRSAESKLPPKFDDHELFRIYEAVRYNDLVDDSDMKIMKKIEAYMTATRGLVSWL